MAPSPNAESSVPVAGPSRQAAPPSAEPPHARSGSIDFVPAPVRTAADYEEDEGDDELVYVAAPEGRKVGHQSTPSSSQLLGGSSVLESPVPPSVADRQERLRSYLEMDDSGASLGAKWRTILRTAKDFAARTKSFVATNEGFLLIAASQVFFAAINTCVKLLQDHVDVPAYEIIFIRMSVTWIGCYFYMRWAKVEHPFLGPPGVRLLLCLRGIVGFFGLFGIYFSLKYLSLSDATVLSFLAPVLVGVLATVVLKESYSRTEAISALLSLVGVVLIAKPNFIFRGAQPEVVGPGGSIVTSEERSLAVGVSLLGVLGASGAYLVIRKIGKRASPLHSISYFSMYSVVVACLFPLVVVNSPPPVFLLDARFFALLLPVGVMGFLAQALLTTGLQREKAGRGTLAVYSNLIYTLILEFVVFDKLPDPWSFLGSLIIVGGAIWVVTEKGSGKAVMLRRASVAEQSKAEEGRASLELSSPRTSEDSPMILPGAGGTGEK